MSFISIVWTVFCLCGIILSFFAMCQVTYDITKSNILGVIAGTLISIALSFALYLIYVTEKS